MPYKDPAQQREYLRNYMKQNRKKLTPEENQTKLAANRAKYPERDKARALVNDRVRKGRWPKAAFFLCTDCDQHAQHYHHEHYDQPTSVEPLCTLCHGKRHRK